MTAPTIGTDDDGEAALLDAGAAIALLIEDHEAHAATLEAVRGRHLGLAGHAWFETYSVLTRLPAGLRRLPADALHLLAHNFGASLFLGEVEQADLGSELARAGVAGGAVYDALVGATARQHGRRLVTGDARARATYDVLGVQVEFVGRTVAKPSGDTASS
jgi:predicted nucleic acid-binding protein